MVLNDRQNDIIDQFNLFTDMSVLANFGISKNNDR